MTTLHLLNYAIELVLAPHLVGVARQEEGGSGDDGAGSHAITAS